MVAVISKPTCGMQHALKFFASPFCAKFKFKFNIVSNVQITCVLSWWIDWLLLSVLSRIFLINVNRADDNTPAGWPAVGGGGVRPWFKSSIMITCNCRWFVFHLKDHCCLFAWGVIFKEISFRWSRIHHPQTIRMHCFISFIPKRISPHAICNIYQFELKYFNRNF